MNAPTTLKELMPTMSTSTSAAQGTDVVHESARLHVTGEAVYTDDIPELRGTLYAALILSPVAHGELIGEGIDRAAILAMLPPALVVILMQKWFVKGLVDTEK